MALTNRFESKIERIPEGGCWVWMASLDSKGYGQINLRGKIVRAHRHIFGLFGNSVPTGMDLCHRCDNRSCVNPAHLFVGSRQDNMDDAKSKGRKLGRPTATVCKHGHVKAGANLYLWRGRLGCRACRKASDDRLHGRLSC
jgi:hypothetical protein